MSVDKTEKELEQLAKLLRALASPIRLRMLLLLRDGKPRSAKSFEAEGGLPAPLQNRAYHLRLLHDAKLVHVARRRTRRGALETFVKLSPRGEKALSVALAGVGL